MINLIKATVLLLISFSSSALKLPSSEISRRSCLSTLATTSTGVIGATTATPSVSQAATTGGPSVMLNSNNKKAFPLASFGLQIYDDDTAYKLTLTALEAGYRNFFASVLAGNQKGFAKVIYFVYDHPFCVIPWLTISHSFHDKMFLGSESVGHP
jgi:hypothetical protein